MNNLSPVEALQREIDTAFTRQFDYVELGKYKAALELAKAGAAIKDDHLTGCDITMGDSHPCTCGLPRKLAALLRSL